MARDGCSWTVVLNPEKRKVGGSTPPLTTTSYQQKTAPHLRKRREALFLSYPAGHGRYRLAAVVRAEYVPKNLTASLVA
jgi:hypothetical protein